MGSGKVCNRAVGVVDMFVVSIGITLPSSGFLWGGGGGGILVS